MRLVLAGIPGTIAQRMPHVGALAVVAALAAAAPASADLPVDPAGVAGGVTASVPGPGATATGALATQAAQPVQPGVDAVRPAAQRAEPTAQRAERTVGGAPRTARGAVEQVAGRLEAARDQVEATRGQVDASGNQVGAARGQVEAAQGQVDAARAQVEAPPADPARAVSERVAAGSPTNGDGQSATAPVLDGPLRLLGEALRTIVPVDSLVEPVSPLLSGLALSELSGPLHKAIGAALSPGGASAPPAEAPSARLVAGRGDLLAAHALDAPTAGGPELPAGGHGALPAARTTFQSASARAPAAEAGGRPGSPPPRKAPAPAVGGAAAVAPGGLLFVPLLALLVLAALAAPKLLRRFDAATAFLRPAPFVCALERPG